MTPSKSNPRLSRPWEAWPQADQHAWEQGTKPARFGVTKRPLAEWCPPQRRSAARWYGDWLGFVFAAAPASAMETPADRMMLDRLVLYLHALHGRVAPTSLARGVCDLYGIMVSMAGGRDWSWLLKVRQMASANASFYPPTPKQFVHARELVRFGQELLAQAYNEQGEITDIIAFRDGLIILMLILVPVRITQFSLVEPGKHLRQEKYSEWLVHWDAPETKTRRDDDYPVPRPLMEVLQVYLDAARPELLARDSKGIGARTLWIGKSGISIGSQTLRKIIKARTQAVLGRPINPHVFRSSAATTYVLLAPERAMEASALLGHTNFRTTERFYLLGRRIKAMQMAHAALEACEKRYRQLKDAIEAEANPDLEAA